jgi:hypothetical protein
MRKMPTEIFCPKMAARHGGEKCRLIIDLVLQCDKNNPRGSQVSADTCAVCAKVRDAIPLRLLECVL